MTDADRKRLAAILGMLGSEHAGERASAALQAEAFRKRHGLEWDQIMSSQPPEWARQAEDMMRDAAERIAELEAEIQSLARRPLVVANSARDRFEVIAEKLGITFLLAFPLGLILTLAHFAR